MSGPHITPTWEQRGKLRLRFYLAGQTHKEVARVDWSTPAKINRKSWEAVRMWGRASLSRLLWRWGEMKITTQEDGTGNVGIFSVTACFTLLQFLPESRALPWNNQTCFSETFVFLIISDWISKTIPPASLRYMDMELRRAYNPISKRSS